MTGPRFSDALAQNERRRDHCVVSVSSRLRARELETASKQIASEMSRTQCLFRRRREELLSSMKARAKLLEKIEHSQQQQQQLQLQQLRADVTCQPLNLEAHSQPTDPYPVFFGRASQKSRANELLEQYHGRRRKSFEFEDAPLRGGARQQREQFRWHQLRARRLSKEFEDLPEVVLPPQSRPQPRLPPPTRLPSARLLSQRRKSREYEDIGGWGARLSPLLSRRRKSKEFEDAVVVFERPLTRRQLPAPATDGRDGEWVTAPLSDRRHRTPAPPASPPASPKSPRGAARKSKFRMTYPVDEVTAGKAEFTTIRSGLGPNGHGEDRRAEAAEAKESAAPLPVLRRFVTLIKPHEEVESDAAVVATADIHTIPAATDAAADGRTL